MPSSSPALAKEKLDDLWRSGRDAESRGDFAAAEYAYRSIVSSDARHVAAQLRLSQLARMRGRYFASRQHALDGADALRAGASWRLAGFLTQRLLEFSEETEVASLILDAPEDDPHVVQQSHVLAQHLWLAGRFEDALRFTNAALARTPTSPLLLYTRGNILRYLGRLDDAADDYEASLSLQPTLADAHWAIATLQRPDPLSRIARLKASLAAHAHAGLDRAQILYALFHELDAAGLTESAWSALEQGAAMMSEAARGRDGSATRRLQDIMGDPRWLADSSVRSPAPQPAPLFIVGLPRTGTTLLDRMLGNHGWISCAGERNDFSAAVSSVADRFFSSLINDQDPGSLLDLDMRRIGSEYLTRLKRAASATAIAIDKNPQNLFNLPLILRALPHAKVLILRRAPMDAAFSNLKELFQGGAYGYSYSFDTLAERIRIANTWTTFWAEAAPPRVMPVAYEDLVCNTEPVLTRVQEFLGVPVRTGLADLRNNTTPVATASSAQVRSEVNRNGIGAWKRYATELEPLHLLLKDVAV